MRLKFNIISTIFQIDNNIYLNFLSKFLKIIREELSRRVTKLTNTFFSDDNNHNNIIVASKLMKTNNNNNQTTRLPFSINVGCYQLSLSVNIKLKI